MRVANFTVIVPEGRERDSGYVELSHGQVYRLKIVNHDYRRCDAYVTIDGKPIGGWRINAQGDLLLERGANDTGRFTFFASTSEEGAKVGAGAVDVQDRGLIQVKFRPERRQSYNHGSVVKTMGGIRGMSATRGMGPGAQSMPTSMSFAPEEDVKTSGVTGLTGTSDQRFHEVRELEYDPSEEVTISIRLIVGRGDPRPLQSVAQGNVVPAPVE